MIAPKLLSMLWCPTCGSGELQMVMRSDGAATDVGELGCAACEATFRVRHGIPTLIPQDSLTGAEWQEWKDHLEKFQSRRLARLDNPEEQS